jgi:hypothetical protein
MDAGPISFVAHLYIAKRYFRHLVTRRLLGEKQKGRHYWRPHLHFSFD